jgi:hypothetical protein
MDATMLDGDHLDRSIDVSETVTGGGVLAIETH